MSSSTDKRPLAQARADAEAFRDHFPKECYERWEIAGSIRRGKPEVADVEHVVIPRFGEVDSGSGLFAQKERTNLLFHHLDAMVRGAIVSKHWYGNGNRWGEKYRGVDFRGFNNEIFCADENNWGAILAIRTGPADFSQQLVTEMLHRKVYRQQGGQVISVLSGEPVPCRDEKTFFEMCGVKFLDAEKRR